MTLGEIIDELIYSIKFNSKSLLRALRNYYNKLLESEKKKVQQKEKFRTLK
jgi:hypothetical protein